MRFERRRRSEGYEWTARKESAYLNRHKRVAKRIERDIPLFADQYAPIPETDIDAEKTRREKMSRDSEQTMRDLDAKHWRHGRASYFACSPEVRALINAEWNVWRGPLRAGYYIYIVEKHSGEAERRRVECEKRSLEIRNRVLKDIDAQISFHI